MYTSFNVTYLGFVTTNTDVGYYSTAIKLYTIFLSFFTAFTGVMMPRMSSLFAEKDISSIKAYIQKSYAFLFSMTIPLVFFSTLNARGIVTLISGPGYEGAILPMIIIMPLLIIVGSEQILIEQVLMPIKKDKVVTFNSFVGAAIGILLNLLLVPTLKSVGSAIVIAFSETSVFILAVYEARKYLDQKFPIKPLIKRVIVYTPFLLFEIVLLYTCSSPLLRLLINSIVVFGYFLIVNQLVLKDIDIYKIASSVLKIKKNN